MSVAEAQGAGLITPIFSEKPCAGGSCMELGGWKWNATVGVNAWVGTILMNDALARTAYRIKTTGLSRNAVAARIAARAEARAASSNFGRAFAEMLEQPMRGMNAAKTNAMVNTRSVGTQRLQQPCPRTCAKRFCQQYSTRRSQRAAPADTTPQGRSSSRSYQ